MQIKSVKSNLLVNESALNSQLYSSWIYMSFIISSVKRHPYNKRVLHLPLVFFSIPWIIDWNCRIYWVSNFKFLETSEADNISLKASSTLVSYVILVGSLDWRVISEGSILNFSSWIISSRVHLFFVSPAWFGSGSVLWINKQSKLANRVG